MENLEGASGSVPRGFASSGVGLTSGCGALGTLGGMKSVISIQSKRLAQDVNHVYDRQILFTTKIQFQRARIEDLTFRIAKAEKELVSACWGC